MPQLVDGIWYSIVFMYGAIVGSFLNVVIYRLPLGKHLSKPASHCPNCNHLITFWENIPLLSFLFLRARCSDCKTPISWRYICVELFTACFWTLLYHSMVLPYQQLTTWNFVLTALVSSVLIALVFIDLDHFIAPDELTGLAVAFAVGRDVVCAFVALQTNQWDAYKTQFLYFGWLPLSVAGALSYGGLLFLVSFVGYLLYAREPGESFAKVARRFFVYEDEENEKGAEQAGMAVVGPELSPSESDDSPPRLAFSPVFLCVLSMLCMAPLLKLWSVFFLVVPLAAFYFMTRRADETPVQVVQRFCRSDDLGLPASASAEVTEAASEADAFAREAETGKHGAMGLGDVKLALGLGAILGPGLGLLSLIFATFLGAIIGGLLAVSRGRSLKYGIPFVPFMAAGAMLTMCYGPMLVESYRKLVFPEKKDELKLDIRGTRTRQRMGLPPLKPGQ